jgi:cytochrome c2
VRIAVSFAILLALPGSIFAQAGRNTASQAAQSVPKMSRNPDAARGRAIFISKCEICHYDTSDAKKIGPGLKGLSKRPAFTDGSRVSSARLEDWIQKGGKNMPGFKDSLNEYQLRDLLAYLKTL